MLNPYFFYCGTAINQSNSSPTTNIQSMISCNSQNYPFYSKLTSIVESHEILLKELNGVKNQLNQVKQNYQELKIKIEAIPLTDKVITATVNKKLKKHFKKNILCPFEGCQSKYSSRIALNSHLRAKHGRSVLQRRKNQRAVILRD